MSHEKVQTSVLERSKADSGKLDSVREVRDAVSAGNRLHRVCDGRRPRRPGGRTHLQGLHEVALTVQ